MEDKILFWEAVFWYDPSYQTSTWLKLASEAQEKGVKTVQDKEWRH